MNTIVKHTVGFIASIVLTLLAVFVTLYTNMTFHAKTTIIFGFAFIQAAVQLLMFMHLTEGKMVKYNRSKLSLRLSSH